MAALHRVCGSCGELHLRLDGPRSVHELHVGVKQLKLPLFVDPSADGVYSGFSEWTTADGVLRLLEAAWQQEGSLAADGINVVLVGDPIRSRVSHLYVSSNRIGGRWELPQCTLPHEGSHCFGKTEPEPEPESQTQPSIEELRRLRLAHFAAISEGIPPPPV